MVLLGFIQADDDVYSERRSKITVIRTPVVEVANPLEKGGEDNMISALEKAKIEFIKKHIRLKPNGSYEYRVRENGKNISKSDKDYNTLINIVLGKIKRRKVKKEKEMSLLDYCRWFFKTYRSQNKSHSTLLEYKNIIENHIGEKFKTRPINKITVEELQEFINSIKGNRIREKVFNFICAAFEKALALGKIKKDPTPALELPYIGIKNKKRALLYAEQCALLPALANYDAEFQHFIIFSLVIGSRLEETCSFKLNDINEKRGLLKIHGTKTVNAAREIKISPSMIKYLKKLRRDGDEVYFKKAPSSYYHRVKRLYKKLKFPEGVDVHSLRRTCSTNLYYLGVPDKQRQQVLGHASIVTTNNIYTFLEHDVNKDKIKKLYKSLYFSDFS